MEMVDSGEVDNKIIAVPVADPRYNDILSLADLPDHTTKEIQNFFETYKLLQKKTVTINGFGDVARAEQELLATREAYQAE
jgi:inorganic pyrophosphatase